MDFFSWEGDINRVSPRADVYSTSMKTSFINNSSAYVKTGEGIVMLLDMRPFCVQYTGVQIKMLNQQLILGSNLNSSTRLIVGG